MDNNNFENNFGQQGTGTTQNQETYTQPGSSDQSYTNTGYNGSSYQSYQDNTYSYDNNNSYQPYQTKDTSVVSTGEWVLTMILMCIPCVNLILCLVWGFGSNVNENKKNFCRAQLIMIAIGVVFSIVLGVILVAVGAATVSTFSQGYYYY